MDVNKRINIMIALIAGNFLLSMILIVSSLNHRHWADQALSATSEFNEASLKYREATEKLEEERWKNLMNRLDAFETKIDTQNQSRK